MNKLIKAGILLLASFISMPSLAQGSTEAFATCLADSLNGKERKELAKWIFLSMTVHPNLKEYSTASAKDRDTSDQYVAKLITRLVTESCPAEMRTARKTDPLAIQRGFEFVGQVAMQEIMTNQETLEALTGYAAYLDQDAIADALGEDISFE